MGSRAQAFRDICRSHSFELDGIHHELVITRSVSDYPSSREQCIVGRGVPNNPPVYLVHYCDEHNPLLKCDTLRVCLNHEDLFLEILANCLMDIKSGSKKNLLELFQSALRRQLVRVKCC